MRAQIEIGAVGDPHQLIPLALLLLAFREETILDVYGALGVVGQFLFWLFVQPQIISRDTQRGEPVVASIDPFLMGLLVLAGPHEVLHLHLFEFARAENEVSRSYLIAKRFTNLRDTEGKFAPARCQHVQKIDEYTLRRFRAEIDKRRRIVFRSSTNVSLEHQVKRTRLRKIG